MKKPETKFKEKIRPLLDALPRSWFKKMDHRSIRGIPDFLGCIRGQFVALELKADDDGEPDGLQEWNIEKILRAGGFAVCVTPKNWEEVYLILKKMSDGRLTFRESKPVQQIMNS